MNIGIIVASTRPNRFGGQIGDWVMNEAKKRSAAHYTLLDLMEINLPFLDEPKLPAQGDYEHESTKQWAKMIGDQDGFLIVTCEYNHSAPGSLKNALDTLFHEWQNKPVSFVGYGAMGGTRAIEDLTRITTNLDMIPQNSSGKGTHIMLFQNLDENGKFSANAHHVASLAKTLDNLEKWTSILKEVRPKLYT